MDKKIDNKKLFRILVVAMIAVIIILGGTYAWIRIGLSASNTNIVKAGALDLVIDESPTDGAEVRLERAIPQSYRQGLTNKPYRFTLKNNSTIDTDYTISLEDLYEGADASLTDNDKIADSLIRYILVKNDDELVAANSKLLSTGRTIDVGTIAGKTGSEATAIPYTLYVWIDSKAGDNATESDIMSKVFNARLKLEAEQHHGTTTESIGDIVLYNPVTLQKCNNVSEANCYEWVVLSTNSQGGVKDLMYLREEQELLTAGNPFTLLENFTSGWNEKLEVDGSYDIDPVTSMPSFAGYEYNKARLPVLNEIPKAVANTLKKEQVALYNSDVLNAVLTTNTASNYGIYYIYDGEESASSYAPYGASVSSSDSMKLYVHPVIRMPDSSNVSCRTVEFKLGDYISMTPTETNYSIPSSLTGYEQNQEINPSELNVWRAIDIHSNGTLDMISEYISSKGVYFTGTVGYKNYVGALNTIASHYENTDYTIGSRYMGYNGQTEYISDTTVFDGSIVPDGTITDPPSPTTGVGQEYTKVSPGDIGDTLYLKDYQLVSNVYDGNLRAHIVGTQNPATYLLASRDTGNDGAAFYGRTINHAVTNESLLHVISLRHYYEGWHEDSNDLGFGDHLRPIVVLKSGLQVSGGSGTKTKPYKLCK